MSEPQALIRAPLAGDPGRAHAVREMFARIAPGYDRANRWMSLGIDRRWRRIALDALGAAASGDVLDLCAGTLDFSLALAGSARRVVAVDFCAEMLEVGRRRLPPTAPVETVCADARELPLSPGVFDGAVIGFGIRNVPEPERVLGELRRVLRPGGKLVIVDFFRPTTLLQRLMAGSYNRLVLPVVGGALTGDAAAYRYLADSMAAWCSRAEFEQLCVDQGFLAVSGQELFPPVASLVVAERGV